jgi:co-chaperonin GroES (HSP10)
MLDFVPLGPRIVIKQDKMTQVGRIIIPETSRQAEMHQGEVLAVGPEAEEYIKPGMTVRYGQYAGGKFLCRQGTETEEFIIINFTDVWGIVRKNGGPPQLDKT